MMSPLGMVPSGGNTEKARSSGAKRKLELFFVVI